MLKDHLGDHIQIIKRKAIKKNVISASLVRKLIKSNKLDKIKEYVPEATYDYLHSEKGQQVIEKIQESKLGRH